MIIAPVHRIEFEAERQAGQESSGRNSFLERGQQPAIRVYWRITTAGQLLTEVAESNFDNIDEPMDRVTPPPRKLEGRNYFSEGRVTRLFQYKQRMAAHQSETRRGATANRLKSENGLCWALALSGRPTDTTSRHH